MKMKKTLVLLIAIILNGISFGQGSLVMKAEKSCNFQLTGFRGLYSFTIAEMSLQEGQQEVFDYNGYTGLALIVFESGQRYPLILNGDFIQAVIHDPDTAPALSGSAENDFLYSFLNDFQKSSRELLELESSLTEISDADPFRGAIEGARENLTTKKADLEEQLNTSNYLCATLLLKARVLMESTYSIKTEEELNRKKQEILGFVKENYGWLFYSDMLAELCNQFFMMEEYVFFKSQSFEQAIISSSNDWLELVKGYLEPKEMLGFICAFYYNRGMVSYASAIMNSQTELVFGGNLESLPEMPKNINTLDELNISSPYMDFGAELSDLKGPKVLAIVDNSNIFSKIETIVLARLIEQQEINCAIVIVPMGEQKEYLRLMNKMFAGTFYFSFEMPEICREVEMDSKLPLFITLNTENLPVKVYKDSREVITHLEGNLLVSESNTE
jgi:hypothetical protein